MATLQKKQLINLLPQEEFAASTLGRILAWILSTFRVIVIITEVVVMGAFLSRFYLDARITDLNDEIKFKEATIVASKDFEKEFKGAQLKISIASDLLRTNKNVLSNLNTIASYTPEDITVSSFTQTGSGASIRAITASEFSIAQLISNLKASKEFGTVELSQVNSTESAGTFNFTLDINLLGGGGI